jgi:hypothetical protein
MTNRHITFQVDSFDIRNGRLALVCESLTLHPSKWTFEQVEIIRCLLADGVTCIAHLEIADNGAAGIASVEAGEFWPQCNADGGLC